MQKKTNVNCAQFNALLTALELANDAVYLLRSVFHCMEYHLPPRVRLLFSFFKVLAGLIQITLMLRICIGLLKKQTKCIPPI
jgi:hypothetical protein